MTTHGTGTPWVESRIANPPTSGSIPARASIIFDAVGGYDAAREMLKQGAFNRTYEPPTNVDLLARAVIWHLADAHAKRKETVVKLSKELSQCRRGSK